MCELATVEGKVKASNRVVGGTITGWAFSRELELQPTARILDDVHYGAPDLRRGAIVQGCLGPGDQEPLTTPGLNLADDSGAIPVSQNRTDRGPPTWPRQPYRKIDSAPSFAGFPKGPSQRACTRSSP
ncbi:polymer-forming cytoskeletal protein [Pigmentiphaga litoralis]|uniref:polymer-forming cytoskeletal protein n=1 Tax=Pigmentiphaga litoralis TaxID=516702 RepID=UPI003B4363B3